MDKKYTLQQIAQSYSQRQDAFNRGSVALLKRMYIKLKMTKSLNVLRCLQQSLTAHRLHVLLMTWMKVVILMSIQMSMTVDELQL